MVACRPSHGCNVYDSAALRHALYDITEDMAL